MKAVDAKDVESFIRVMKRPVSFWEIKIAFEGKVNTSTLYKQLNSGISHERIVVKKVVFDTAHVNFFFIKGVVSEAVLEEKESL